MNVLRINLLPYSPFSFAVELTFFFLFFFLIENAGPKKKKLIYYERSNGTAVTFDKILLYSANALLAFWFATNVEARGSADTADLLRKNSVDSLLFSHSFKVQRENVCHLVVGFGIAAFIQSPSSCPVCQ